AAAADVEGNRAVSIFKSELRERQPEWFVSCSGGGRECTGKPALVEGGRSCSLRGVGEYEFGSPLGGHAVAKTIIRQPYRAGGRMQHQRVGVIAQELFGAGIVVRGERLRLRQTRNGDSQRKYGRC